MKVRVCVRTCTSGAAPFAILSVFFRGAQWAYICYFDLRACLHVSDCPGADARHIIVNPLICLVYTNALIWRGVPSTVAGDHKVISVQCIRGGVVQVLVWVCVCVCVTMSFLTPGTHLPRAALVRVLRQLHVGPHRPGCPLLR